MSCLVQYLFVPRRMEMDDFTTIVIEYSIIPLCTSLLFKLKRLFVLGKKHGKIFRFYLFLVDSLIWEKVTSSFEIFNARLVVKIHSSKVFYVKRKFLRTFIPKTSWVNYSVRFAIFTGSHEQILVTGLKTRSHPIMFRTRKWGIEIIIVLISTPFHFTINIY